MNIPDFTSGSVWVSLITLTFIEIVLGIDNIIFITIISSRLEKEEQPRARTWGLLLAMLFRILFLFAISAFLKMQKPVWSFKTSVTSAAFSIQSLILIAGGLFLLYKASTEIFEKLEGIDTPTTVDRQGRMSKRLGIAIWQISLINLVFSFDSILTAIGLTKDIGIMMVAVVLSILIMMWFSGPVGNFVNQHPSIQMLGLSFLILIGFMLLSEGAHQANFEFLGNTIGPIPRQYLYFTIAFSLFVEFLNLKIRKRKKPLQLHGVRKEAVDEGIMDKVR